MSVYFVMAGGRAGNGLVRIAPKRKFYSKLRQAYLDRPP